MTAGTLSEDECWVRLAGARHGVLSTVHSRRGVDAVPVVFALAPGAADPSGGAVRIVIPIDVVKGKRSARLQRVINLERDPRCVLLVDHYEDDWTRLWWVRLHARAMWSEPVAGVASASPVAVAVAALAALANRYPQYREAGSVVGIVTLTPTSISGWQARA